MMEQAQFETRLKCAVRAGWITSLIGIIWIIVAWCAWICLVSCPTCASWVEWMWGGVKLAEARLIVLAFFGAVKMMVFACVLVSIFLTVWHRRLRKAA
ncbi:MAG: hypothetical protein ABIF82_00775 [Planctomycetota bacterium]